MQKKSNRLVNETSPYLLQHAHNPVDWYPWNEEALQRSRDEDKPILVSIGYSACHWCHVMERESFENEETAAIMNEHFINIKIDREERPDLDHIYMDAVQAMTGAGGWPLNIFLTPDKKPFYGGTYFPPQKAFNRPSWTDVLLGISLAYKERRHEIDAQAEQLTDQLLRSNELGIGTPTGEANFSADKLSEIYENIMNKADKDWGGFGKAPKFPQTYTIQYLLRDHHLKNARSNEASAEDGKAQALLSLDKMIEGGIYDQAGGGFSRYATDTEWLVPHFEKMLYDNALLLSVISEACQLTHAERYREVITETMDFIQRELMDPGRTDQPERQGFYSALDADSEGVEGKFYVWEFDEVKELLGKDSGIFSQFYDITPHGNWEEKNILRVKRSIEQFAAEKNLGIDPLKEILATGRRILMEKRKERIRPLLDDKIILGWNALMNTAVSKAFSATGNDDYRQLAISNMQFLLENFKTAEANKFYHTWKNNEAKYPAFLDDYAFLIEALINLQEITGDTNWLDKASELTGYVMDNFSEPGTGYFFFTRQDQDDVIIRKKELYDGAVPSGNSVMAYNLHRLGILLDKKTWLAQSGDMVAGLQDVISRYPTSFGNWACLLLEKSGGTSEVAILGKEHAALHREVLQVYLPHKVLMAAEKPVLSYPLLAGKEMMEKPSIWLCRNYTCQLPVFSVKELTTLINRAPGKQ